MKNEVRSLGSALVVLSGLLGLTPGLRAAEVNFNDYTSPADNDLANQFLVGGTYQQVPDHGITGGAVALDVNSGGFATYRVAQAQPTTVSISFLYDDPPSIIESGPSARLGWVGDLSPVDFLTSSLYFWGEFYNDGSFNVRNNPLGGPGTGSYVTLGSITPPSLGHWLQLSFSAVQTGGNDYRLTVTLEDLGTTGLDGPIQLFSEFTQVANPLAAADDSMHPGFFGYYHASYYDNFVVQPVPEPGTFALLAGAALMVGATAFWRWKPGV